MILPLTQYELTIDLVRADQIWDELTSIHENNIIFLLFCECSCTETNDSKCCCKFVFCNISKKWEQYL